MIGVSFIVDAVCIAHFDDPSSIKETNAARFSQKRKERRRGQSSETREPASQTTNGSVEILGRLFGKTGLPILGPMMMERKRREEEARRRKAEAEARERAARNMMARVPSSPGPSSRCPPKNSAKLASIVIAPADIDHLSHYDELITREVASFPFLDRPEDLMMHFIDIGCGLWIHLSGGTESHAIQADSPLRARHGRSRHTPLQRNTHFPGLLVWPVATGVGLTGAQTKEVAVEFDVSKWKARSATEGSKSDEEIWGAVQSVRPVIWLLGKTGAGKTSLVAALTGLDALEIGNGFVSCTKQSKAFDYPTDQPLIRFLDTRGLGETGYNPQDDIEQCAGRSHALLVVARNDDPVQGEIADVLRGILAESPTTPVGIVHTGTDLIDSERERHRARLSNQKIFENAVKKELPSAQASLGDPPDTSEVLDLLAQWLPLVAYSKLREEGRDAESDAFRSIRPMILKFATAAGAVDVAPVVGLIGVPGIQGAMLRGIGKNYGTEWSRKMSLSFAGTLGASTVLRFTASLGIRQAAKLVPGWGQTIGAASAAAISFSTTFALGRAASYYLFKSGKNEDITHDELKAVFEKALRGAEHETDQKH